MTKTNWLWFLCRQIRFCQIGSLSSRTILRIYDLLFFTFLANCHELVSACNIKKPRTLTRFGNSGKYMIWIAIFTANIQGDYSLKTLHIKWLTSIAPDAFWSFSKGYFEYKWSNSSFCYSINFIDHAQMLNFNVIFELVLMI